MRLIGLNETRTGNALARAISQFSTHDMLTHVRAVTYQVLFSLFPFIIFFMALLGFFDLSDLFDWLRRRSEAFFLAQTAQQVNLIMDQLQQRREGMLSFSMVFSVWASSSAMRSLMKAMNVVYGIAEGRPIWKRYVGSILTTLVVGIGMAAVAMLLLVRPQQACCIHLCASNAGGSQRIADNGRALGFKLRLRQLTVEPIAPACDNGLVEQALR